MSGVMISTCAGPDHWLLYVDPKAQLLPRNPAELSTSGNYLRVRETRCMYVYTYVHTCTYVQVTMSRYKISTSSSRLSNIQYMIWTACKQPKRMFSRKVSSTAGIAQPTYILTDRLPGSEIPLLLGRIVADFASPTDEYPLWQDSRIILSTPKLARFSVFPRKTDKTAWAACSANLSGRGRHLNTEKPLRRS